MSKKEIKQKIVESQKSANGKDFTKYLLEYLPLIEGKAELDEFVGFFSHRQVFELVESGAIESMKKSISDKIFEIILQKNDTISVSYINLYLFYKEHGGIEDERLDKFLEYLKSIDSSSLGDIEKCYVYNMRFVLQILRGDDGALEDFLSECMILHMHKTEPVDQANSVRDFLQKCEVPVETVFATLKKRLELDEYLKLNFHQRRSIFNWSLHVFWNVPRYYGSRLWSDMYETLKSVFYAHLDRKEIGEAMYVQFFIYHKMGNIFQTQEEWARFNEEISIKAVPYYQQFAKEKSLRAPKKEMSKEGKKKIGILKDRLVENSPFKVEYSLLKALMEDEEFKKKYEIKVYNMSYYEKSANDPKCERKLHDIGIEVFDGMLPFYKEGFYHSHLSKAIFMREMMLTDEIDILICAVGAYDICDFLLSTRCAPKQIYWSHGNHEYDVDGIDERISHFAPENHKYEFKKFSIPMDEEYLNPPIPQEKIDAEREKYPKDAFILGTIGRLVKVDSDEYLEAVAEIMKQNPNTIYIAAGSGDTEGIRKKVEKLGISDRFYMPGFVDAHVYGHIIELMLDTFPIGAGLAADEYAQKGKPYIMLLRKEDMSKDELTLYQQFIDKHGFGKSRFFAFDPNDYVQVANHLVKDDKGRGKLIEYIKQEKNREQKSDIAKYLEEFEYYGGKGFMELISKIVSVKPDYDKQFEVSFKKEKLAYEVSIKERIKILEKDKEVEIADFLNELCFGKIKDRLFVNYILAEYFCKKDSLDKAKVCVERAWLFSEFSEVVLPLYIEINEKNHDFEAIKNAYKRLGMEYEKGGDIASSLSYFTKSHYAVATYKKMDEYSYDFDIIDSIKRMAKPYIPSDKPAVKHIATRKKKIAFLIFGMSHKNSAIVKMNKIWLKNINLSDTEVTVFVLDKKSIIRNSLDARRNRIEIIKMGHQIKFYDDDENDTDRLIKIAKDIQSHTADILVCGAPMAEYEHTFIVASKPAKRIVGVLYGPPEQFCFPFMDSIYAPTYHPALEAPAINIKHVPLAYESKNPEKTSKSDLLNIEENMFVIMSAGRPIKFQNRFYWQAIADVLKAENNVLFLVAGINFDDVKEYIVEEVKDKVVCLGWCSNVNDYISVSDVYVDTYPSGGGLTMLDAMSIGIPIVAFENDFERTFSQACWSLAYELLPSDYDVIKLNDISSLADRIKQYIKDKKLAQEDGHLLREHFYENILMRYYLGRTSCLGNSVFSSNPIWNKKNIIFLNNQKSRVDMLLDLINNKVKVPDIGKIRRYIIDTDVFSILKTMENKNWIDCLKQGNFEFLIMDSFSELAEQKFTHKKEGWHFSCYYSQVNQSDDFMSEFEIDGLLREEDIEAVYSAFFSWFFGEYADKKIFFLNMSTKYDERDKFKNRAKIIQKSIDKLSSFYENLISVNLEESLIVQNNDGKPYHFSMETYLKYLDKILTSYND